MNAAATPNPLTVELLNSADCTAIAAAAATVHCPITSSASPSANNETKAHANKYADEKEEAVADMVPVADSETSETTNSSGSAASSTAVSSSTDAAGSSSRETATNDAAATAKPTTRLSAPGASNGGPTGTPRFNHELHHNNNNNNSINNNTGFHLGARQRTTHVQEQLSKTNLYIRGLQSTTKDQDLHDMCNRFGHISSTKAILDRATGCCRGYGFVEFVNAKSAELAVRELTKSGIQAQMAKISPSYNNNNNNAINHQHGHHNQQQYSSQKSHKTGGYNNGHNNNGGLQHNHNSSNHKNHADPTNLYIANLPSNMSEPELEELLSNYGNIVSTRILRDESNNPRGVGFARMESRDNCEDIIEQLNGRPYKGSSEPLVVKFADGGNKKRHHHNNHQHHNNNHNHHNHLAHQNHHNKVNQQDEAGWQENVNSKELGGTQSYDHHQANLSHSNQAPDLAMMGAMRMQPGFPPNMPSGGPYPPPLGSPSSAPQWIHPAGGQPYVVPPQMTQAGGLSPSSQAAAAAAMHYGHIPHLAAQMQGLQITHASPHVGGYLPPQHQWPALWPHPIPQQQSSSPMGRLSTAPMQSGPNPNQMAGQHSSQMSQVQQPQQIHQSQPQRLTGQQPQPNTIENKLHVSVPL